MVEHILAVLEDLSALSEFPKEGATEIVLIASEFDTEWKGAGRDGGGEVAAAKGVDRPAEAQHLLCVTRKFVICRCMSVGRGDGVKLSKCEGVDR